MAEMAGGMLCFSEEEAAGIAGLLRHYAPNCEPNMSSALMLLANQLQTEVGKDPFSARRFSISVEPRRTRQ